MDLTYSEFQAILDDVSKSIDGEIEWKEDEDHSPARIFRVEVMSQTGWPLFIAGNYNPLIPRTSYHLIHRQAGRIYGLDLGKEHRNPDATLTGERHKHTWDEAFKDKHAYVPRDITAPAGDPVAVWNQFCQEARIDHRGTLKRPPDYQLELLP